MGRHVAKPVEELTSGVGEGTLELCRKNTENMQYLDQQVGCVNQEDERESKSSTGSNDYVVIVSANV